LRSALDDRLNQEGFWVLRLANYPNPDRPNDSLIDAKIKFYKNLSERADGRDSLAWWMKKNKLPKLIEKLIPGLLHKKDIIKPTDQTDLFALGFTRDIYSLYINFNKFHLVKYSVDSEFYSNNGYNLRAINDLSNPQNTKNTLVSFNSRYALFDSNGIISNPNSLTYSGVLARKRVAELLPTDYKPQLATGGP
jgi:hypothetical protein